MNELKPCPFCGGKAVLAHDTQGIMTRSYVQCNDFRCGVHGKKYTVASSYTSDEKAIDFWNNRKGELSDG